MNYNLPGSSIHGTSQARIQEWVAISFSRGSSWPRDGACVSWVDRRALYPEPPGKSFLVTGLPCLVWMYYFSELEIFLYKLSLLYIMTTFLWQLILYPFISKIPRKWPPNTLIFFSLTACLAFFFFFKLYNIVLVLPNIEMNPPQVYMCSPSWTLLPPPSPFLNRELVVQKAAEAGTSGEGKSFLLGFHLTQKLNWGVDKVASVARHRAVSDE